jgi:restriction system-associated AAA family ATPase
MKLLKLEIGNLPKEKQFRSLHAGFKVEFHSMDTKGINAMESFSPFCFAGLNGSGKSNVLEALAAIFFHMECCVGKYKPDSFATQFRPHICSPDAFILEYLIWRKGEKEFKNENFYKVTIQKELGKPPRLFRQLNPLSGTNKAEEESINPPKQKRNQEAEPAPAKLYLPDIIVGYSSGENEILSIPFRKSRLINFDKYKQDSYDNRPFEEPENSLIYIDAEMSQAVLLSCLLLEEGNALKPLEKELGIVGIHSFRLNINNFELHKLKDTQETVKLLNHCKSIIEQLKKCSTCWNEHDLSILYEDNTSASRLTLDFLIDNNTKKAFKHYFKKSFDLFRFFQMLYELNLLSVEEDEKFEVYDSKGVYTDWKIPDSKPKSEVFTFLNYFILKKNQEKEEPESRLMREISDGEHQFLHTMGICLMLKNRRSLLLLDEPETHFNPSWRAKFIKILNDSINAGSIDEGKNVNVHLLKDILLTSHSPFIISDCMPDNVILFKRGDAGKVIPKTARELEFNTYGASVDLILQEIFGMAHSISERALEEIRVLLRKRTVEPIIEGAKRFGESYEKGFLYERIEDLKANKKKKAKK